MTGKESDFEARQEPDRIHRLAFWITGAATIAVIAGSAVIAWAILTGTTGPSRVPLHGPAPPNAPPEIGIVEQRLFEDPARGPALRAKQRQILESWGWIDRSRGVARIPIDRAMNIIANRSWETL